MFSKFTMLVANENTPAALRAYAAEKLSALSAVYGVYAVDGNHEFHTKQDLSSDEIYKRANITLLHDTLIEVADCFYIAGRNDPRGPEPRAPLSKLLSSAEKDRPVLLLSHRPTGLAKAKEMEVDLELSGHTHHGQLFPANLVTSMIYDVSYGHMQDGNFQIIVSSGYGTWGYPIRTGSRSEMVRIQAAFR